MTGSKDIASIVPVLDKNINDNRILKIGRPVENKKDMDKIKMFIESDFIRITGNNKYFSGWKYDEKTKPKSINYKIHRKSPPPPPPSSPSAINKITWSGKIRILTKSSSTSSMPTLLTSNSNSSLDNINITRTTNTDGKNTPELKTIKKEKINIDVEINGLADLIKLIKDNPLIENAEYNIDIETLHKIKPHLIELNDMIGMTSLKDNIVDQVIYYIQNFHKLGKCQGDFMHTVIYGPPGTGKTEIAKIIGRVFCKLGILNKGIFKKVTRADLIAGYLGQTAIKTKEVIKECLGGVLFIDEAYALGNSEKRDSFSKECIDTLCEALSDNKDNIMVIIAGYEKELKSCFFNYNDGLESRFTWRFKTDEYNAQELKAIFLKKVKDAGWEILDDCELKVDWFNENKDYFKYYGRDMETLFAKTKICHSRRVFCKSKESKTKIIMEDIEKGFKLYLNNDEVKSRKDNTWTSVKHMYS